jgi:23S rRNA pseudouridine2605 synthase
VATVAPNLLRITIHEGRNRQVRRMCEAVGHPVIRLVRTRIGPLRDPNLKPGAWRPLAPPEVRALERAAAEQRPTDL